MSEVREHLNSLFRISRQTLGRTIGSWAAYGFMLLVLSVVYGVVYFGDPALPGSSGGPAGWLSGADQGEYLKSAKAFAEHSLAPGSHLYPPVYSLLAYPFVESWPNHAFLPIDILCFLIVSFGFFRVAGRYVGTVAAVAIFVLVIVLRGELLRQYVIPWTSTPVAALFSLALVILDKFATKQQWSTLALLSFGFLIGLLLPTRPVDAVVFSPLLFAFGGQAWLRSAAPGMRRPHEFIRSCVLVGLGLLCGPILFLGFNQVVFHSWLDPYLVGNAAIHGFTFSQFPEKAVSFLFDSGALYLVPGAALLNHYPWLVLSGAGLVLALLQGPLALRAVACCIIASVFLYFSYNDLLPNGIWHYSNIHYFVWMMPWLGVFSLWPMVQIFRSHHPARIGMLLAVIATSILVSLLRFDIIPDPARVRILSSRGLEVDTTTERSPVSSFRFVDLTHVNGNFRDIYFGAHSLSMDGRRYLPVVDFRILPAPWGARLLFMRELPGEVAYVTLDPHVSLSPDETRGSAYRYRFALGMPCWLIYCGERIQLWTPYSAGSKIDFAQGANGDPYLGSGWSDAEIWGRWSTEPVAEVNFLLPRSPGNPDWGLDVLAQAFLTAKHPKDEIAVDVNGERVARWTFDVPERMVWEHAIIPRCALTQGDRLNIRFVIRNPVTPLSLGLSGDNRSLGIGIKSAVLRPLVGKSHSCQTPS